MNLTMTRREYREDGIFGTLTDENGEVVAMTIEHAYTDGNGGWAPKVPEGEYTCERGQHMLHSGPIETFEVTGVPGHSGVLLHPGNEQSASQGCILLGEAETGSMITNSRKTFEAFMALEDGLDQFQLTVTKE